MGNENQDHRWRVEESEFSVCKRIEDVSGFFGSRQLVIDPGMRAIIIDKGSSVGEVGPGTYTLKSFSEALKFWKRKQATAILTRQEDAILKIKYRSIPTIENLGVFAAVQVAVQMEDVALFARNLMGPRDTFTMQDLKDALNPLVGQVLWEECKQRSITELTGHGIREQLDASMNQALTLSMRRYGIRFVAIQLVHLSHPEYDEQRQEKGNIWLQTENLENIEGKQEVATEERLLELKQHEKGHELDVLEANLDVDREEGDLAVSKRRIGVRTEMLAALRSKHGDTIEHKDEMATMLQEYNKGKLIRQEEMDELTSLYEQNQEDRESARRLVIAKLNAERDMELSELREALDHQMKLKRLDQEIELAKQTDAKDNVIWLQECERARKEAEQHHEERLREINQHRQQLREENITHREEEWDNLVHLKRLEQIKVDVELAELDRKKRVQLVSNELQEAELAADKRRSEVETEISRNEDLDQIERLKMVNEMNAEAAERTHRHKIDMEILQADSAAKRALQHIEASKNLRDEALIATANSDNAALLADFKKTEATASSGADTAKAIAQERKDHSESLLEITKAALGQSASAAPPAGGAGAPPPPPATNQWSIAVDGKPQGPYTGDQMQQYIADGRITAQTQVYKHSTGQWLLAGQVAELSANFGSAPPPPPPPPTA